MKHKNLIALIWCIILLPAISMAQTFTWNGSTSTSWSTSTNWTPSGPPTSGSTVVINNAMAPNQPSLLADETITTVSVTNASLNLNGYKLTTTTANFTGANVSNGSIDASNISTMTNSSMLGGVTITKLAGTNNVWAGGNTFQSFKLVNNDNNYIRMANTTADVFNGNTQFVTTDGYIEVAYNQSATFNGNVTIDASGVNGIRFGQNGGSSTIASGYALLTNGYTSTQLIIKNLTQNGTTANGSFTPINFTPTNCVFGGNFTCAATGTTITTSQFKRTNYFTINSTSNIRESIFSSVAGTTVFDKTAGGGNTWYGGNTFYNTTVKNFSPSASLIMANNAADVFHGTSNFVSSLANRIYVAYKFDATFSGNVYVDNDGTRGIYFGASGGNTTISAGNALLTHNFAVGYLYLYNVTQSGTAANGTFAADIFYTSGCVFGGNFTLASATQATMLGSTFSGTNVFVSDSFVNVNNSIFSNAGGTTSFTKNAGSNNTWSGGNTFYNTTFTNNSATRYIRFANLAGDIFNGTTRFNVSGSSYFQIGYLGSTVFNGNVYLNSTSSNGIFFGVSTGTTTIASGYALLTTGFTGGTLSLKQVTQNGSTTNATFSPATFIANGSSIGGNMTITGATTAQFTGSTFSRTNSFTATNISTLTTSNFSTTSGTTSFTKNGGTTDTWAGGNTFKDCTFTNSSTNVLIRIGTIADDVFNGTTRFVASGSNYFQIAYTSNATFNGNVYLNSTSSNGVFFGTSTGSTSIASGFALLTTGFATGTLSLIRVTQNGSTTNSTFSPVTFVANGSSIGGNMTITGATTAQFIGSTFSRTNSFTATNISALTTSNFSTISGTTSFTKTGGVGDTWAGGNTFANCTFTNSSTNVLIRIGTTAADVFNGTTRFVASGSNYYQIAYSSDATFNGNVYLNSTSSNGIFFGASTGNTTIASGFAILTTGFATGTLSLIKVTQNGATTNSTFSPATFIANASTIRGNLTINASSTVSLTNSVFQRTNVFTAATFSVVSGNNFSATSGTTTMTKTGVSNDIWAGGNTFYRTVILNNSAASYIRLAGTNGDTYIGTTRFAVSNAATILPAYNGTSAAAGNVYIDCTGTGGISVGAGSGTLDFSSGYSFKTNGYSGAPLTLDAVTQTVATANDSFNVTALSITNSTFAGSLTIRATTAVFSNSTFSGNNKFYANTFTTGTNCVFSQGSASTTITKYGATNDTWVGGNTYGNVTLRNRSNGRIRLANSNPDTHAGTIIIVQDSTGVIEIAYNGTNSFGGNISIVGSTSTVNIGGGSGTVQIDGNTAQSILGGGVVTLNIPRINLSSSGNLTLQTPVTVSGQVMFSFGRIVTDATNLLILLDNATVSSANNNSCVVGPVRKVGNDAFTFPVGNFVYYAPIAISAPSNVTDHFTAEYFRTSPDDAGYDTMSMEATMELISTREYWNLNRTNGSSAVEVTMSWGAHSSAVLNMTALRVAHWDASGSIWNDLGFKNFVGTEAAGSVTTANAVTSFSPFSFGSTTGGGALPVEMTTFTGSLVTEGVALDWTTQVEINNDHYTVERSVDGTEFEAIGEVKGAGNSSIELSYRFIDTNPKQGLVYYRLKQVDIDGEFENSDLVAVFIKGTNAPTATWSMYPNPAKDKLQIAGGEAGMQVEVEILDQNGRSINHMPITFGNEQTLDVSGLSPGMYVLRVQSAVGMSSQRFVKQ